MSGLAVKVIGSALFTIAGAVAVLAPAVTGSASHANDGCPEDMHWLVCETVGTGIDSITDTVVITPEDMHW